MCVSNGFISVFLSICKIVYAHGRRQRVPDVFLAVMSAGISLSLKCDVTECRSRP